MKSITIEILILFILFYSINSYSNFTGTEGVMMLDSNGVAIQAHGGQIQKLKNVYYWIGEDKTNDYKPCLGIHMYTSLDLYNWYDEGLVLKTMKYEKNITQNYMEIYLQKSNILYMRIFGKEQMEFKAI